MIWCGRAKYEREINGAWKMNPGSTLKSLPCCRPLLTDTLESESDQPMHQTHRTRPATLGAHKTWRSEKRVDILAVEGPPTVEFATVEFVDGSLDGSTTELEA